VTGLDRKAIAARIRGIVAGQDDGDATVIAGRLRVDEAGLRTSIDYVAPNPTVEIIVAVVAAHGVDPCWLLTGEYDPATHRGILEGESVEELVAKFFEPGGGALSWTT
jgi:hypothetical protein